jgi:hypothetical protein
MGVLLFWDLLVVGWGNGGWIDGRLGVCKLEVVKVMEGW